VIQAQTKMKGNHTIKRGLQIERAQNLRLPSAFTFTDTVSASVEDPGAGAGLAFGHP